MKKLPISGCIPPFMVVLWCNRGYPNSISTCIATQAVGWKETENLWLLIKQQKDEVQKVNIWLENPLSTPLHSLPLFSISFLPGKNGGESVTFEYITERWWKRHPAGNPSLSPLLSPPSPLSFLPSLPSTCFPPYLAAPAFPPPYLLFTYTVCILLKMYTNGMFLFFFFKINLDNEFFPHTVFRICQKTACQGILLKDKTVCAFLIP